MVFGGLKKSTLPVACVVNINSSFIHKTSVMKNISFDKFKICLGEFCVKILKGGKSKS
jgi:hypothetical protein